MMRLCFQLSFLAAIVFAREPLPAQEPEASNWPPAAYPLSRYESAWSRNPFDLKTTPPPAPILAPPPGESFAKNLVIAGITKVGERETLILFDQLNSRYHRVTTSTGADGLRLVSIQHDPKLSNVVARIAKGNEEADIRYARRGPARAPVSKGTDRSAEDAGTSGRPAESQPDPESGR